LGVGAAGFAFVGVDGFGVGVGDGVGGRPRRLGAAARCPIERLEVAPLDVTGNAAGFGAAGIASAAAQAAATCSTASRSGARASSRWRPARRRR